VESHHNTFAVLFILLSRASLAAGMGNLFAITGRMNCGLSLAGRK